MAKITLESENVAEALLELLAIRGVEYFVGGGAGTDFPFIIEAYAKAQAEGKKVPIPITAVHEITAVSLAHGYAMVSGKPLFTLLHTIVGLANGICGVINASRARVPLFLAAGKTATSEKGHPASRFHIVQWGQEAFDQGGMLREFVKWDYQLNHVEQLEASIDRGLAITQTHPAGPVYLTLPVEVSGAPVDHLQIEDKPRINIPAVSIPVRSEIKKAVDALVAADRPLIITSSMGREPAAVPELVKLAENLGLPVIEYFHTHLNFPQDHPLHLGFKHQDIIRDADVIMVIEADAPWTPVSEEPGEEATIIVLDEDPLYTGYPYRGFPNDITLGGNARETLCEMNAVFADLELDAKKIESRKETHTVRHQQQRLNWEVEATAASKQSPIDPKWISKCIADQFNKETDIVITEFILDATQICITHPGSYFDHSHAGGLGWSSGAALGAKLAEPDKTILCCIGDGTYTFGVPVATHQMSAMHDLPVLFVIFNNAAWDRTRRGSRYVNKTGYVQKTKEVPLCELAPAPAYEMVCEAAGGYGERVDEAAELPAALERALKVVREEGRQALLNVICSKV